MSDVGFGLLAHARSALACSPNTVCALPWMHAEVAYLFPYKPPPMAGTCLETDRMLAEHVINAAYASAYAPTPPVPAAAPGAPSAMECDDDENDLLSGD